jgi:broad specificity phosphatase PhoE
MINEILKHYSESSKLSLVIRHGDRDKIPNGSFGNEIRLNESGLRKSIKFGESISNLKVNKIFTSPIERCIQTAECISKGYGTNLQIIETSALGAPGLHIKDEKLAGEFLLKYGVDELYKRFINEIETPGIPSKEEINLNITKFINEQSAAQGINIFVTHDLLIACYHYSIDQTIYKRENWVNYLSGILLKDGKYEK